MARQDLTSIVSVPGDIPLYRSRGWYTLRPDDPRRWRSTVRAADAWWAEGRPSAIADRLREEVTIGDLIARWRVRLIGWDVREVVDDWGRVLDVQQARAAEYRPPERTPRPWSAEDLDPATWREVS